MLSLYSGVATSPADPAMWGRDEGSTGPLRLWEKKNCSTIANDKCMQLLALQTLQCVGEARGAASGA